MHYICNMSEELYYIDHKNNSFILKQLNLGLVNLLDRPIVTPNIQKAVIHPEYRYILIFYPLSPKLKTEYRNETQYRTPGFINVVMQFCRYKYFC